MQKGWVAKCDASPVKTLGLCSIRTSALNQGSGFIFFIHVLSQCIVHAPMWMRCRA